MRRSKDLTTDYLTLDIWELHPDLTQGDGREAVVTWTRAKGLTDEATSTIKVEAKARDAIGLRYAHDGTTYAYDIGLEWLAQPFGGERPYWLCPACQTRCRKLYGGHPFVCRKCRDLAYPSEYEKADWASLRRKLVGLVRRLDERGATVRDIHYRTPEQVPIPHKPPRMWWSTYSRIASRYYDLSNRCNAAWASYVDQRYGGDFLGSIKSDRGG